MPSKKAPKAVWERLDGETARAFAGFCTFRDMPATERDYRRAWIKHCGAEQKKEPSSWRVWAAKYNWRERAVEFDAFMDSIKIRSRVDAAIKAERVFQELLVARQSAAKQLEYDTAHRLLTNARNRAAQGEVSMPLAIAANTAALMLRRSLSMPSELPPVEGEVVKTPDELFFQTDGEFADRMPDGVVPTMPENVLALPRVAGAPDE